MFGHRRPEPVCGLYYSAPSSYGIQQTYLPQVDVKVHASILATTSRTALIQTFINPSTSRAIRQVRYAFPLYDGVSVVGFSCQVGDRTILGEVKEKETAKDVYKDAVARGETAGLFEQLPDASDVFTTTIGNIPPGAKVVVNITYLGELKHDMEVDGIRFTVPTHICPRYEDVRGANINALPQMDGKISITVDAEMTEGSFIQKLQSPTHPIAMSMGTTSVDPDATPTMSKASATLTLATTHLDADFVLQVIAKDTGVPKAILEVHHTIPNHRALMATLVPKFSLPANKGEVVFVCDQSGSMGGSRMELAREALQVFLKSIPVGIKFNICSFGSSHSFLWPRSVTYAEETLNHAVHHAEHLQANYGGTDILDPLKGVIENRYTDMPLDIILLTDGAIWDQQSVFDYLNEQIQEHNVPVRVFTLGIGSDVSHALIEGVAKAGNGFSQSVGEGEKMGTKVVRMLKGALSPHINDYTLEVKYPAAEEDDEFEFVEKVADSLKVKLDLQDAPELTTEKKPMSLYDTSADLDKSIPSPNTSTGEARFAHLIPIPAPKILQAPQNIPSLFAFNRTSVYLLLGPDAPSVTPTSVVLRGTSIHGPLELEIPVQVLSTPGETIHQLAAKRAVSELEQGRGWLAAARDTDGCLLKKRFDGRFSDLVEREAVRLGVKFQVGGKWCSFVATEKTKPGADTTMNDDWEFLEDEKPAATDDTQAQQQGGLFGSGIRGGGGGGGRPLLGGRGGVRLARLDHTDSAQQQQQQSMHALPQSSASSLFGGTAFSQTLGTANVPFPPPPATSLFGAPAPASASQPSSSLFGASNSHPLPPSSGLFGCSAPSAPVSSPSSPAFGAVFKCPSLILAESSPSSSSQLVKKRNKKVSSQLNKCSSPPEPSMSPAEIRVLKAAAFESEKSPSQILQIIIGLQAFSGAFPFSEGLLSLLSVDAAAFKAHLSALTVDKDVLFTAVVVVYLEKKLGALSGEWELIDEKARGWLASACADTEGVLRVAGELVGM